MVCSRGGTTTKCPRPLRHLAAGEALPAGRHPGDRRGREALGEAVARHRRGCNWHGATVKGMLALRGWIRWAGEGETMRTTVHEKRRKTKLGRFGEIVVSERLTEKGHKCAPLGDYFPCFDIEASKNARKF